MAVSPVVEVSMKNFKLKILNFQFLQRRRKIRHAMAKDTTALQPFSWIVSANAL